MAYCLFTMELVYLSCSMQYILMKKGSVAEGMLARENCFCYQDGFCAYKTELLIPTLAIVAKWYRSSPHDSLTGTMQVIARKKFWGLRESFVLEEASISQN